MGLPSLLMVFQQRYWLMRQVLKALSFYAGKPKHDAKPAHEHKGHYGKPKHAKGHYGHAKPAKHEHKGHYGASWAACCPLLLLQGHPL